MDDILIDGAKIRQLRKNKGWSQMDLARIAWVDQGTISQLENNAKLGIRMDTLVRLARCLGAPTDQLLVPADGTPVETADPQLDVMTRLVRGYDCRRAAVGRDVHPFRAGAAPAQESRSEETAQARRNPAHCPARVSSPG